jgi:lysyl-tRNA synthetase, class II
MPGKQNDDMTSESAAQGQPPAPEPSPPGGPADDLVQIRAGKLERLREAGIDPFPAHFDRSHSSAEALAGYEALSGQEISVAGRMVSRRVMGRASFAHLQDGAGRLQLYVKQDLIGPEAYSRFRDLLDTGDFLGAKGTLFQTRTGETTLEVHELCILAKSLRPLPEKWHGLTDVEARYRQRYLDLVSNPESVELFKVRTRLISAIRRYLDQRGFLEVETPVLQAVYGGAAARPFRTYYNALERDYYLRIATELYLKRLIVGGLEKVYEIGRVFRNEGVDVKHNPEFTLLESYEAYADYQDVMAMVEDMIPQVTEEVLGTRILEREGVRIDLTPPWRRISLRDAILEHTGVDFEAYPDQASLYARARDLGLPITPTSPRGKIVDELLSSMERHLVQPTFLIDYPVELSPLAKRRADNPRLVERFEAFAAGVEIANAFSELNDPVDQTSRFLEQAANRAAGDDEAHQLDEDYVLALEHGMPPTGGLGIGIDRLLMFLTGRHSLREVILFPQLRSRD